MADAKKMSIAEFAQKIKAGHPEYAQLDDQELANRVLAKFPQYREHVDMQAQSTKEPSTYDKLTAPGASEGAMAFDAKHPIAGKALRAFDAAGGAVLGLPGFVYHSFADPTTPQEQEEFAAHKAAGGWGQIPGEVTAERLLGGRSVANALRDYGAGKVSPGGAISVLSEAIGTGAGTVAGSGLAAKGLGQIRLPESAQNAIANRMRYSVGDPDILAKPGEVKPIPYLPAKVQEWFMPRMVPRGKLGSPVNPGYFTPIPDRVPGNVLQEESLGPVGSPTNPGPMSKIPTRVPASVLRGEQAAATSGKATPKLSDVYSGERPGVPYRPRPAAAPVPAPLPPRTGPLLLTEGNPASALGELPVRTPPQAEVLGNIPNAGEAQALRQFLNQNSTPLGRIPVSKTIEGEVPKSAPRDLQPAREFPKPIRPLIGSPEEWQAFENQMGILTPEAKAAGMYSAARGSTRNIPDYQIRIGNRLRNFGEEEK